ncbi:MAG: BMC domain-containing protein [Tepidanaerobacteraceae bacterium]|jgi:ethanolamine utilization protein EutM
MSKNAIGLIETRGLVAAVEAVDACLKAANVEFMSYRFTTGGLVCVIVTGEVGAVRAAVDAGLAAAGKIGEVVGIHVIPRPAGDTMSVIEQIEMSVKESSEQQEAPDIDEGGMNYDEKAFEEEPEDEETEQDLDDEDRDEDNESYSEYDLKAAVASLREMLKGTKEESVFQDDKALDKYGVRALRRVMRVIPMEDIDKSQISSMKKKELLSYLLDFIKREGRDE